MRSHGRAYDPVVVGGDDDVSLTRRLLVGGCACLFVVLVCAMTGLYVSVASAAEACPNEALRLESNLSLKGGPFSTQLPDCRAYELVTPVYKEGFPVKHIYAISADGSRMIGGSYAVLPGQENNEFNGGNLAPDEFTRTGSGWTATPLSPNSSQFNYHAFTSVTSTDLTRALWELNEPSESAYALDLFVREPDGSFVKVGPLVPPSVASSGPPSSPGQQPFSTGIVVGASSNLSRILFSQQSETPNERDLRWPGDTTVVRIGASSLYEYTGTGNSRPELVGVGLGGSLISTCRTQLGGEGSKYNAVASDGETVFFTSFAQQIAKLGEPGCTGPAVDEIYARVGRVSGPVPISEPTQAQCQHCLTSHTEPAVTERSASFQGASVDGSKVFFTTEQELFKGQKTENLYEYDFDNPLLEKVLLVSRGSLTPEVRGITQISQDGSHVYFVAGGVLSGANGEGRSPVAGQNNMYVFERDSSYPLGRIAFVATLAAGDSADWQIGFGGPDQATPDGRFLVFSSKADLTSDDSSTVAQLFEYDAQEEKLVRISVGQCPNGLVTCASSERFNSDGNILGTAAFAPFFLPSSGYGGEDRPAARESGLSVSDDGAYVFFRSADGLTESALNRDLIAVYEGAKRYAWNVYEYHSNVAAAGGSIAAGSVSLISDGQDAAAQENGLSIVQFLGTDASGGDAFFWTVDSLVAQDSDTALDVYDARVGGGFPAPVAPSQCAGEACQGGFSSMPSFGSTAGSATTVGGDNLSAVAAPTIASPVRGVTSRPRVLTRAQKLRNALRTCGKDRSRRKRAVCEARARKQYGGSNGTSVGKSGGRSGK